MKLQEFDELLTHRLKESMCEHTNIEYSYDYDGGYAYVEAAQCEDCGKDMYSSLSDAEVVMASEIETESRRSELIDSAVDHQRDIDAGLV